MRRDRGDKEDREDNAEPWYDLEDNGCQCTLEGIDSEWVWEPRQGCYVCKGCGLDTVFKRVSCFCRPKAGKKRIVKLQAYFPELYVKYLRMCEIARRL